MSKVIRLIRYDPVLTIAALAALISCFFVPPDRCYPGYIDFRTIVLLYCLMTVVSGLRRAGAMESLAQALCARAKSTRAIGVFLVGLCFFSSMLITNDVALLTFVPFASVVLGMAGRRESLCRMTVLQTAAANLGSMLTPVGNPQNLYLYSHCGMSLGAFFSATFPLWLLSLAGCMAGCLLLPKTAIDVSFSVKPALNRKMLALYTALFAVCLLTVVRILPWPALLFCVILAGLVFERKGLLEADFLLLLTFAAFFVFAGNLARIGAVSRLLGRLLDGREYLLSLLTSQIISNVPAALLLSEFTDNARALLQGINVGGLGTPIASLASLISLKIYARTDSPHIGRFLLEFTAVSAVLLLVLSAGRALLG